MANCILKQNDTYLCFNEKHNRLMKKVYFASQASLVPEKLVNELIQSLKLKHVVIIKGESMVKLRETEGRMAKSLNLI